MNFTKVASRQRAPAASDLYVARPDRALLEELGIGRESKRRALMALEAAGILSVQRRAGRRTRVSLKTPLPHPNSQ